MNPHPDERLSGAAQENILVVLCFSDEYCKTVRAAVTPKTFDSDVFRLIAGHAINHIDHFGEAIKQHLPDVLEPELNGGDAKRAQMLSKLLLDLHAAKDEVNAEFAVRQLHTWVRQQTLKTAVVAAVQAIEAGRIDDAEVALKRGLQNQSSAFSLGTQFSDPDNALAFLDHTEEGLLTGIAEIDRRKAGPAKKEQWVIMAPAGFGKTWALIHMGKWAILQRQCVLHVTLEMSEARCAQRYVQSFFAVSKREAEVQLPTMRKSSTGHLEEIFYEKVMRKTLDDPNIRTQLAGRLRNEFSRRRPLIIKQFPTGTLTVGALEAYLDGLERHHKIVPDVVIIDYPDLFKQDNDNLRTSIGQINKELRGLAVERNFAEIIASQANRVGAQAKLVEATHAAEDYSKIATADTVFTYSQTPAERKLGLARAFAAKVRNEEGGFVTLLTQSYNIGQFALDSAPMGSADYWDLVNSGGTAPRGD